MCISATGSTAPARWTTKAASCRKSAWPPKAGTASIGEAGRRISEKIIAGCENNERAAFVATAKQPPVPGLPTTARIKFKPLAVQRNRSRSVLRRISYRGAPYAVASHLSRLTIRLKYHCPIRKIVENFCHKVTIGPRIGTGRRSVRCHRDETLGIVYALFRSTFPDALW